MTQTATINLTGASGATYTFQVYPWGTPFNPVGAVYTVLRQESDGRYTILYIGETGDLSTRFDNHHKQACFDRNRRTHIGVHMESSSARRLQIEADLVRNYNPVCNDQ